jgi:hypothetical protein
MEIWLGDLRKALEKLEDTDRGLCQYVASIQGAYHGVIFCMTSGEIWRYITDTDELIQMKGDWR